MSRYFSNKSLLIGLALFSATTAASAQTETQKVAIKVVEETDNNGPLLRGTTLSFDIAGLATKVFADYGSVEGALRINLKDKYFPVFELGYAAADHTDETTQIRYKTSAPYFRGGIDFNVLRNKRQGNKLFVGLRGGFTAYNYDYSSPEIVDPIWQGATNIDMTGVSSNMAWAEIVFGLEAEVFRNLHMGWSVRYKSRLSQKDTRSGDPWYVPGYGTNGSTKFGATYNLVFDIPLWSGKKTKERK